MERQQQQQEGVFNKRQFEFLSKYRNQSHCVSYFDICHMRLHRNKNIYNFIPIQQSINIPFLLSPSTKRKQISFQFFSCQKSGGTEEKLNDVFTFLEKICISIPRFYNTRNDMRNNLSNWLHVMLVFSVKILLFLLIYNTSKSQYLSI